MTQSEINAWQQHLAQLNNDVIEYNRYDAGYTYKQKQIYSRQRERLISSIKRDILEFPPFAAIAHEVCNSSFCFDECYDSMDGDMECTIRDIFNKHIDE